MGVPPWLWNLETAKVLAALQRQDFLSQPGADPALSRAASTYEPTVSAKDWGSAQQNLEIETSILDSWTMKLKKTPILEVEK